jgi:endonuclease G
MGKRKTTLTTTGIIFAVLLGIFVYWIGKRIENYLREKAPERPISTKQPTLESKTLSEKEALEIFLPFGNPSNADKNDLENYLLVNQYMVISYSRSRMIPNWVAWRVTPSDLGNLEREDSFRPDDRLPRGFEKVFPSDYTGSGFDRGHLCPSADRTSTPEAMASTFLMTNIAPQTPDLNRGPWEKLESYLRTLVRRRQDVYVIAGNYGEKGKIRRKIVIPTNFWKIAVVLPTGKPPSSINEQTRVIAVDMPNVKGIRNDDWFMYRTTARKIEQKTGYNFFSNLPRNLQDALETKIDNTKD